MTEEESVLLGNLNENIRLLFDEYENVENKNGLLKEEINGLKSEIQVLEKEKLELGQKMEQMKLATLILSGVDENREAKQKINKLIREIDKCIALLNK
jgi:predicted RNase H-like nuclease (RuvC/YqgF family)